MDTEVAVVAVTIATLVILGYLLFIWWLDRYEREPLWLIGLTFLWGAFGGTCAGCVLSVVPMAVAIFTLGPEQGGILSVVLVAPLAEELTKGLVFIPLVLSKHFDNETDGLMYGAATGLGFAALENVGYYVTKATSVDELFHLIVLRTLFTALVHCVSSALLGMSIGYARHRSGFARWLTIPLLGYLLAVVNHGIWNFLASSVGIYGEETGRVLSLLGLLVVAMASVAMFLITQFSLKREHDVIKRFLQREARKGTIPDAHAEIIPYWTKRRRSGWISPSVPKEEYVRAATLLAFRQHQLEIAEGERQQQYRQDIQRLRQEVRELLGRPPEQA